MKIRPSFNKFQKWEGNLKPCYTVLDIPPKEAIDLLFKIFKKIQGSDSMFLFSGKNGRYSFLAQKPFAKFSYKNGYTYLNHQKEKQDPITSLRNFFNKYQSPLVKELPNFYAGGAGFFGYEVFSLFEKIPTAPKNDLQTPDIYLNFYDQVIAFDHVKSKLYLIGSANKYEKATKKVEELFNSVQGLIEKKKEIANKKSRNAKYCVSTDNFKSNFSKKDYFKAIQKVKKYLVLGDTFQVNFSQRLETAQTKPAFEVFKIISQINPSPFGCYMDGGDFQIISSSPERLIQNKEGILFTQPIAGTRPRGQTKREDNQLAQELKSSSKETAEHTMLVDLERNDLGKVSEFGTVITKDFAHIEKYSHVQHLVSNIYGKKKKNIDFFNILKAVFPGGTITGVPKIRTMEIISELEPTQRGPYTGSLGYIGFNGNFDLNILIRTIVCTKRKMYIQVGGGIVIDSDAAKEYEETWHKAEAMLEAISKP